MENAIKVDTAFALALQVDDTATRGPWTRTIEAALTRKGGFNRLLADLNSCLEGVKRLEYTPDGVPAFVTIE